MEKAAGYVRVSTEEQAEEGVSLDMQRQAIERYCSFKGLQLVDVWMDRGVSAATPLRDRPGGGELLSLVGRRGVMHAVGLKLDRLFRDTLDCLEVVKAWDRQGVALHLIDMGGQAIDTRSAVGKLFLTMLAAFASFERDTTAERTRAAMRHKRLRRERTSLDAPYGWDLGDGPALVPVAEEQQAVDAIMAARADGATLQAITDMMNSIGLPCRGERWHLTTVARIVKRENEISKADVR